jgi:Recombination, repair and ssDNA binding protein UvsY
MKLEDIYNMWEKDAKYDDLNLDAESLNISSLHAKYNRMLSETRSQLRSAMIRKKSQFLELREYYLGNLNNTEDLTRINRQPFLNKVMKNEVNNYIDADGELIRIDERIALLEEKVEVVIEIMKCIHKRSFDIKHAIEWRKFTQGF